jgi:hypothetical protein
MKKIATKLSAQAWQDIKAAYLRSAGLWALAIEESLEIRHGRSMKLYLSNMLTLFQCLIDYATGLPDRLAFGAMKRIDTMDKIAHRQLALDKPQAALQISCWENEQDCC